LPAAQPHTLFRYDLDVRLGGHALGGTGSLLYYLIKRRAAVLPTSLLPSTSAPALHHRDAVTAFYATPTCRACARCAPPYNHCVGVPLHAGTLGARHSPTAYWLHTTLPARAWRAPREGRDGRLHCANEPPELAAGSRGCWCRLRTGRRATSGSASVDVWDQRMRTFLYRLVDGVSRRTTASNLHQRFLPRR